MPTIPFSAYCLFLTLTLPHFSKADATFENEIRPVLAEYCFGCHGDKKVKGDVNLEDYKDLVSIQKNVRLWDTVVSQLEEFEMPPDDEPQPTDAQRARLIAWINESATNIDVAKIPKDPGRATIRRLNRTEYNNTVRDLLGIDFDPGESFPADGTGGAGFDNNADTLFLPPILMEKYLAAAREVAEKTFASEDLRNRILIARPNKDLNKPEAARRVLRTLATRAFRRPVSDPDLNRLLALFHKADARGDSFEDAIKLTLQGILTSPQFLFRQEIAKPGAKEPYRIDDFELATRLSYFLWSSMPDQTLFDLAAKNLLHDPKTLDSQIARMLASPKSVALAENFAGQWLGFEKLQTESNPDKSRFPEFTPALRDAMVAESIAFFTGLIREDRSVLDILDSDYAYLNESLANHYGLPGVTGPEIRKVAIPPDRAARGGVLGMGSTLTLTSLPLRTSPVKRGLFVLDTLLGTPPPPPPPDAGILPADDRQSDGLTFRQRLEAHRDQPSCANCHKRLDPLGFGLEPFDPIGRWRTEDNGTKIDATGELPDGNKFEGPGSLKKILLGKRDLFAKNISQRLLAYALGRGVEFHDLPTTRHLTETLKSNDYRIRPLISAIVQSYPFQNRRP